MVSTLFKRRNLQIGLLGSSLLVMSLAIKSDTIFAAKAAPLNSEISYSSKSFPISKMKKKIIATRMSLGFGAEKEKEIIQSPLEITEKLLNI